jgi:hypothetical protein
MVKGGAFRIGPTSGWSTRRQTPRAEAAIAADTPPWRSVLVRVVVEA